MKTLKCRPGDLAVIVDTATHTSDHMGQLVEVLGPPANSKRDWAVAGIGFLIKGKYREGAIDDCFLKPLRGNPDEQAEREREVVA